MIPNVGEQIFERNMEDHQNKSCEPMDIDLSAHSVNEMDISYNSSITETITTSGVVKKEDFDSFAADVTTASPLMGPKSKSSKIKKYHINIQNQTKKSSDVRGLKILFVLVVLVISIVTSFILNIKCTDQFHLEHLKDNLSAQLFGQIKAIETIIDALDTKDGNKILFFYGGTGVGKTYTASLIMEHYGYSSNIYHYTMPSFASTFSTEFMLGLIVCKTSMIIVDDLTASDMHIKTHISNLVTKVENMGNNVTVILIYNCDHTTENFAKTCHESFHKTLLKHYLEVNAMKKFVKFEPLTEEHLRKCIEKELGNRKINTHELAKIEKNFNVSLDGCKGVHTKMKFLNIV